MYEEWKKSEWINERLKLAGKSFRRKSTVGKAPVIALIITFALLLITLVFLGKKYAPLYIGIGVLGLGTFLILLFRALAKAGTLSTGTALVKKNTMIFGSVFFHKLIEGGTIWKTQGEENISEKTEENDLQEKFIESFDAEMASEDTESLNEGGLGGELCVFVSESFLAYECRNMDGYDCLVCRLTELKSARTMSLPGINGDEDENRMYVVDFLDENGKKILGVALEGKERFGLFADMLRRKAPHIREKISEAGTDRKNKVTRPGDRRKRRPGKAGKKMAGR